MRRIDELRGQILTLQRQIGELQSATIPASEVATVVKAWLADQSDTLSLTPYEELVAPGGYQTTLPLDPARLMLGLFHGEIQERLTAHLVELNQHAGLPADKRAKKVSELVAQRREFEAQEEIEILAMEDRGEEVTRRPDADAEVQADVWAEHLADDGRLKVDEAA